MRQKNIIILLVLSIFVACIPSITFAAESISTHEIPVVIAKATPSGTNAVKVSWLKTADATQYVVYGNLCGKKAKKLKTLDETKTSFKVVKIGKTKLKKSKVYSFSVFAYKDSTSGDAELVSQSKECKVIVGKTMGKKNEYSNAKSIKIKNKLVKMEIGDSGLATNLAGISSKMNSSKKHLGKKYGQKYSYIVINKENEVDDSMVKIDEAGNIQVDKNAQAGDIVTVYVQELNGVYNQFGIKIVTSEVSYGELDGLVTPASGFDEALTMQKCKELYYREVSNNAAIAMENIQFVNAFPQEKDAIKDRIDGIMNAAYNSILNARTLDECEADGKLKSRISRSIVNLIMLSGKTTSVKVIDILNGAFDELKSATDVNKAIEIEDRRIQEILKAVTDAAGVAVDVDELKTSSILSLSIKTESILNLLRNSKIDDKAIENSILECSLLSSQTISAESDPNEVIKIKDFAWMKQSSIQQIINKSNFFARVTDDNTDATANAAFLEEFKQIIGSAISDISNASTNDAVEDIQKKCEEKIDLKSNIYSAKIQIKKEADIASMLLRINKALDDEDKQLLYNEIYTIVDDYAALLDSASNLDDVESIKNDGITGFKQYQDYLRNNVG